MRNTNSKARSKIRINQRLFSLVCYLFVLISLLYHPVYAGESILKASKNNQETSKVITLKISSRNDGNVTFYIDLLTQALALTGHQANIQFIGNFSHLRQIKYLQHAKIDLIWRLRTDRRDQQFHRVNIGLTNGMIGQRVFLIPKGKQWKFDTINNLAEFIEHKLIGAFGERWFDIEIWKYNQLPYIEIPGDNNKIYRMLASEGRNIDYLSRGINEIIIDANLFTDLEIEQRLLFIYQRDMYFYLGPSATQYHKILESSLQQAKVTGLIDKLINKHWGDLEEILQLSQRIKIQLKSP